MDGVHIVTKLGITGLLMNVLWQLSFLYKERSYGQRQILYTTSTLRSAKVVYCLFYRCFTTYATKLHPIISRLAVMNKRRQLQYQQLFCILEFQSGSNITRSHT